MTTYASHNAIVGTFGNQVFVPPGLDVCFEGGPGGDVTWNVQPGQPIMWDPVTGKTLDESAIGTVPEIKIGIGNGSPGGIATGIFTIGKDEFELCKDKLEVEYSTPCCGQGQQIDINLGCVKCDSNYQMDLYVKTPWTKRLFGGNGEVIFPFDFATRCNLGCEEDCDPSVECFEVACGMVDRINSFRGEVVIPGRDKITLNNEQGYYQPFWAVVIPNGKKIYHACLSLTEEGDCCESCAYLPGLESLEIEYCTDGEGGTNTLEIDLTAYQTPAGNTTVQHMQTLQTFINNTLHKHGVHAQIQRGIGKCCQYQITIAGCVAAEPILTGGGDPVFKAENPFKSKKWTEACKTCGTSEGEEAPGCKIRIFLDSIILPCKCGMPASDFGNLDTLENRVIDVQFRGESWHQPSVWWEEVVEQVEPRGFGFEWIYEYLRSSHRGGEGNFNRYGGSFYGDFSNLTMPGYQFGSGFGNLKCDDTYCLIDLCFQRSEIDYHINSQQHFNLDTVALLIPMSDKDTHDAFKTVFDRLVELDKCAITGEGCFPEGEAQCGSGCEGSCEDTVDAIIAGDADNGGVSEPSGPLNQKPVKKTAPAVVADPKAVAKAQAQVDSANKRIANTEDLIKNLEKEANKLKGSDKKRVATAIKAKKDLVAKYKLKRDAKQEALKEALAALKES